MERVLCLLMGYVFGLFQTGYLYSRSKHMDIRNYGSGNSGSTNVLRVMGKKAGLIVFLGDAGKMIAACLITRVLFRSQPELLYVYLLYTGFGVILGHNFPFYMGFKGGKGIAASAGLLASTDWRVMLVCPGGVCGCSSHYPLCIPGLHPGDDLLLYRYGVFRCPWGFRHWGGTSDGILCAGRPDLRHGDLAPSHQHQTTVKRHGKQAGCQKGIDLWQM